MSPQRLVVDPTACRPGDLTAAVDWLRGAGVVAYPTDTLYGLAVDPASALAVAQLFEVKGRDTSAALPLIAASTRQVEEWCGRLEPRVARLAQRFWPGPLALVLDAPERVASAVHAGRGSIAIRVPAHPVARALAEAWDAPLTATSANRSGEPAAIDVSGLGDVGRDSRVLVVDGGPAPGGAPSTIVDARGGEPLLVRAGAIDWHAVLESWKK